MSGFVGLEEVASEIVDPVRVTFFEPLARKPVEVSAGALEEG